MPAPTSPECARERIRRFPWRALTVIAFFGCLNVVGIVWIRRSVTTRETAFRVIAVKPSGETPETKPVITAFFSGPVRGAQEKRPAPNAVILDPPVPGIAFWASESSVAFYPAEELERGREYRIRVSESLRGAAPGSFGLGLAIEGPREFRFSVAPVKVLSAHQLDYTKTLEATLRVVLNARLEERGLRRLLRLRGSEDGADIPYEILRGPVPSDGAWAYSLTFRTQSPAVQVVLAPPPVTAPAAGESGARAATKPSRESVHIVKLVRAFRVASVEIDDEKRGAFSIRVLFTHPLDSSRLERAGQPVDLSSFFEIHPPLEFRVSRWGSAALLAGDFRRQVTYTVTVKKGLPGEGVGELLEDFRGSISAPALEPRVAFASEGTRLSSRGNLGVALEVANVEEVTIEACRVYENNFVHFLSFRRWASSHFGRSVGSRTYRLARNPDRVEDLVFDIRDVVGADARGLWYLRAFGPRGWDSKLVSVTDLCLAAKSGRMSARPAPEMMVWVTSLRTADPVPGAAVSLWTESNQKIAEAVTDDRGLAFFDSALDSPYGRPKVVTASKDGDLGYLLLENERIPIEEFDVGGKPYFREGHHAFVFTERGVYRPGERVYARTIVASAKGLAEGRPGTSGERRALRAAGSLSGLPPEEELEALLLPSTSWSEPKLPAPPQVSQRELPRIANLPPFPAILPGGADGSESGAAGLSGMPIEWEILRPDGRRLCAERAMLGENATAEIGFSLPEIAPTGRYEIRVRLPGGGTPEGDSAAGFVRVPSAKLGATHFLVEEYMPNRIRAHVRVVGDAARFRPGEEVPVAVEARYLFGLPAQGCPVKLEWRLVPRKFQPEGWAGYTFGPSVKQETSGGIGSLEASIGEDGFAYTSLEIPAIESAAALDLVVHAEVADVSGRTAAADAVVPVDPAPFYLGLRIPEAAPSVDRPERFACAALDPFGRPAELKRAELIVWRVERRWIYKLGPEGQYEYERLENLEQVCRRSVELEGGRGEVEIAFQAAGEYRLELAASGTLAKTEADVYVIGDGEPSWTAAPTPDRVQILCSRARYLPGEHARVLLQLPFPGTVLVCADLEKVEWAQVFRAKERSVEIDVPVPDTWVDPNFYISAAVVRGVDPEAAQPQRPRALGILSVPIDLSERKLSLTISAPAELRPGSRGRVAVSAATESGEPVRGAEVSLALVDAGLVRLTRYRAADPFAHFFSKRAYALELADTYGDLLAEIPLVRPRSRPGGDRGETEAPDGERDLRLLSPISAKRVKPAVCWLGPALTLEDGSAVFEFQVPAFTGELRVFAVANEKLRRFGFAESGILVRSPFFFELGLPRFLAPEDRFVSSLRLFNQTPFAGRASLTWNLSGLSVEIGADASLLARADSAGRGSGEEGEAELAPAAHGDFVELPANGVEAVVARMRAGREPKAATVELSASLSPSESPGSLAPAIAPGGSAASGLEAARAETYVETVEIPIRPASPLVVRGESGRIAEEQPLELRPSARYAFRPRYKFVLSKFPEVELANAIRYLIHYPYGCLEQTTSSAFPLVYLRDLIEHVGVELPEAPEGNGSSKDRREVGQDIERFVLGGIARILSMQSRAGFCSMWPGGTEPWPWGSIYAAHFLIEARAAGYPVPEAELEALLAYVREVAHKAEANRDDSELLERAYALYVLFLASKGDPKALESLSNTVLARLKSASQKPAPEKNQASVGVSASARCLLAAACFRAGKSELAKALLGQEPPSPGETRDTGGALRSPARETALVLSTLLDVDPASPFVDLFVERLRRYRVEGRWATTQENAFAILALGKYARRLGPVSTELSAEVKIGDAAPLTIRPEKEGPSSWKFEGASMPASIRVSISGAGSLFYSWTEEGIPLDVPQGAIDSGLEVRRRYLDVSGSPLDLREVRAGETVVAEICLRSERSIQNLAVVDLLPAGLEVENPNLEGKSEWAARLLESARKAAGGDRRIEPVRPDYTSYRDDRVIAFVALEGGKLAVFHHVLRAVTRGDFQVPPVRAEALYDPTISSISGAVRMVIR